MGTTELKGKGTETVQYHFQKYRLEVVREETFNRTYGVCVTNPKDVHKYLVDVCKLHKNHQEMMIAVAVNTRGEIIGFTTVSIGDICSSFAHPREVFKFAICCNAASIILAHNHPSEDPEPSNTDITTTKRIAEAGEILGIHLLDHIIVGNESRYASMREKGLIN